MRSAYMSERGEIDWISIESEYRAGEISNRHLAKRHGISESAVRKQAKSGGWIKKACAIPARPENQDRKPPSEVDAGADPVDMGRDLCIRLLAEIDASTGHLEEIESWIYEETANDVSGSRRAAMLKAISLPTRATTLKTIMQALQSAKAVEEAKGKKVERQETAEKVASSGKFAPPKAPTLVINNR